MMSIKTLLPFLMIIIFSFISTSSQNTCDQDRTYIYNYYNLNTTFSNYITYITSCYNQLTQNPNISTTIDCNNSSGEITSFTNMCEESYTDLTQSNTSFSGKWCTFTFSYNTNYNKTKQMTFGVCDSSDCTSNTTEVNNTQNACNDNGNLPSALAHYLGSIPNDLFPADSTDHSCTYKCGGFPVWAIIVIVLVAIAVVVIIIVVVVVMLRRKSSYQNI